MQRHFLFLLLCLLSCYEVKAQKENHQWIFGHNNGLNFNSGVPVFFQAALESREGAASVSDKDGNLLFYSNGNSVWDANHNVMPNGSGLLGNGSISPMVPGSSTQGVAIVQFIDNRKKYYVFVLEAVENIIFPPYLLAYLRYSVVDMSLNNGLGAVIAAQKNVIVDSAIGEQMYISRGDGCNYWLIVHSLSQPVYKAFMIDVSGIHPPVVSQGIYKNFLSGEMKLSSDETKIALTVHTTMDTMGNPGAIELGNFNKVTGVVSGVIPIDTLNLYDKYGLSFSPDNSKLYSSNYPSNLVQYDISSYPDAAAINNSKTVIATGGFAGMRIGPDQKIYIAPAWPGSIAYIARINDPDLAGTACNLDANALPMPAYSFFPNGTEVGVNLGSPVVVLNGADGTVHNTEEISLCPGDSIILSADGSYTNFHWENGATERERMVKSAGIYWVTEKQGCGIIVDSFKVYQPDPVSGISESDTSLCAGASVILHAFSGMESLYLWSNGSNTDTIIVAQPGVYRIAITNNCGTFYDSVSVGFIECDCKPFMPNVFSPNQDGLNDIFRPEISCPLSYYVFSIYNRYGQRVFLSRDLKTGWDGTYESKQADHGTYFYHVNYTTSKRESFTMKGDLILVR